jgi:hypothetical protein
MPTRPLPPRLRAALRRLYALRQGTGLGLGLRGSGLLVPALLIPGLFLPELPGAVAAHLGSGTLAAQIRQDDEQEATRRAEEERRRGEPAERVLTLLQAQFQALPADLVRVLSRAGFADEQVATAVAVTMRNDAAALSRSLREAEWGALRTAQGLRKTFPRATTRELWDSMEQVGFSPSDMADVLPVLFLGDAAEAAAFMRAAGWSPTAAARQLRVQYSQDAGATVRLMREAGWSLPDAAVGITSQWTFEHADHLRLVLQENGRVGDPLLSAMEAAGLPNLTPTRVRYEINETRAGMSGMRVNDGVFHRPWATDPDPHDGLVWVVGEHLDRPEVRFFLGSEEGQIRGFSKEGSLDRVELFFSRVGTAPVPLTLRTLWGGVSFPSDPPVPPRGIGSLDIVDLQGLTGGLRFVLGDPMGQGRLELGNFPAELFELEPVDLAGTTIEITGIESGPMAMSFTSAVPGPPTQALRLSASLSAPGGQAFQGHFLEQIPCWVCQGYEVPESACGPFNLPCYSLHLGMNAVDFVGHCANPANWERKNLARGPAIPFSGSLSGAALTLDLVLEPSAQGRFQIPRVVAAFSGNVLLHGAPPGLTPGMVKSWLEGVISSQLAGTVMASSLPQSTAARLNQVAATKGWDGHVAGISAPNTTRLRVDLGR